MRAVSTDPSTNLALNTITFGATDRVALLHSSEPQLALQIAKQCAAVTVYDYTLSTLNRIRQQADARKATNITFDETVFPHAPGSYDAALLVSPKGRDYGRALIIAARRALRPGGNLYLVGPNEGGAKTFIEDMAVVFGSSATLAYKQRHRVGVSVQPGPEVPFAIPEDWGADPTLMIKHPIDGHSIYTMPGIFSWDRIDGGTRLLLDSAPVSEGDDVLDVGCGNGVIGLHYARNGAAVVTMVDDNLIALYCARANAAETTNAEALPSDLFSAVAGRHFDLIVSNPPFHQKFDVDTNTAHRIMREAIDYLNPGGRLVIVANAFLKYEEVMIQNLERFRELANDGKYKVLEARRPEKGVVKPGGVRGSKRRAEQDDAQRFRNEGVLPAMPDIRTVEEDKFAPGESDDDLEKMLAELEAEEADFATNDPFLDEDDDKDFDDDLEDDFDEDDFIFGEDDGEDEDDGEEQ